MNFDINEVLAQMLGAIKGEVKENWHLVKDTANNFLQGKKDRLALLASFRIDNEISEADFEKRLKNEALILESELHAVAIITKVIAQNAANAAIDVLNAAVNKAIGIV